ncbi:MAG: hypothetical protein PUP92_28415 [Rhizonema sp. PD38]|nr:hypothetical protein [Rhizonema sp. PD38]
MFTHIDPTRPQLRLVSLTASGMSAQIGINVSESVEKISDSTI